MSFDTDDIDLRSTFRSLLVPSLDVLLGTTLTALTLLVGLTTTGLARAVLGLALLLYLQGYAVVAAVLPGGPGDRWVVRRLALPFGVSLALLPPLGLAIDALGVPFSPLTVLGAAAAITVTGLLVAGRRRVHRSGVERGGSVLRRWAAGIDRGVFDRPTTELLINGLTLVAVATAMAGIVFAAVAPAPAPQYASFSVLTENESGEAVAADYPTNFTAGEGRNVVVEIANRGPETQRYTMLVQLQRFDQSADAVTARSRLVRLDQTVAAGETWNRPVTVTPDMTGREMRLAFLLYADGPPPNPTAATAEEHLFLWVNVTGGPTTGPPVTGGGNGTGTPATGGGNGTGTAGPPPTPTPGDALTPQPPTEESTPANGTPTATDTTTNGTPTATDTTLPAGPTATPTATPTAVLLTPQQATATNATATPTG